MKCVICRHGKTREGEVTVTLDRNGATLVFRNVPAMICDNCGEQYVNEKTGARLLKVAEQAAHSGVQVDIRRYA